jgi:hypothetical protein
MAARKTLYPLFLRWKKAESSKGPSDYGKCDDKYDVQQESVVVICCRRRRRREGLIRNIDDVD